MVNNNIQKNFIFLFLSLIGQLSFLKGQDLFIANGTRLFVGSGSTLSIQGNLDLMNTSGIEGQGTLVFNGTSKQNIRGESNQVPSITFDNNAGIVCQTNLSINGNVNLGATKIKVNEDKFIDVQSNQILRTSGFIEGNLQKTFSPTDTFKLYEIGSEENYFPIRIYYSGISSSFSLKIRATNVGTDTFPPIMSSTKFYKGKYVLNPSIGAPSTYSASVEINTNNLIGGANISRLVTSIYSSGSWSNISTRTAETNSEVHFGLSKYGELLLAELNEVNVSIKVFLQGFYVGNGKMKPVLFNCGVIENIMLVDSITVELRQNNSPYTLVASIKGIIDTAGLGNFIFNGINPGNYYLVVKHRNHLETWSASSVAISSTGSYDFTNAANKAYGNNLIEISSGKYAIYGGDVNQDDYIDTNDFTQFDNDSYNYLSGYLISDVNGDGYTDTNDFTEFDNNSYNYIGIITPM